MRDCWKYSIMLALLLAIIETTAWVASGFLIQMGLMLAPLDDDGYDDYMRRRDPALGWPSVSDIGKKEFDADGTRVSPAFPYSGGTGCVSLFGDSFTWGDEVGPEHAYGNVLAEKLGCRVANYGVGGYGTDQAFLRYFLTDVSASKIAILGHYSENIVRNVNQLRDLMGVSRFGFKPRFIVGESGTLQLVPLPKLSGEEYIRTIRETKKLLPYEHFVPDTAFGSPLARPIYTFQVARAFTHFRVLSKIKGRPSYQDFYSDDHPSDSLHVTTEILKSFSEVARHRGHDAAVMIIPDVKDLEYFQSQGEYPFDPLIERLKENQVRMIPLSDSILSAIGSQRPCEIYTSCDPNGGHFNEAGYALVASIVFDWIVRERLRPEPQLGQGLILQDGGGR